MKKFFLELMRSNKQIQGYAARISQLQTEQTRRAAAPIAVIDDKPFIPQTNLQNYGYKITPIGDVKTIEEVASYPIVLCDIMGVGLHLNAKLQGASIIAEIKRQYPEKIVIAYTGAAMNDKSAKAAADFADKLIKKDIDIEEWVETLDQAVKEAVDPYIVWNKVRRRFVEMGVDTKDILVLEDAYVRAVLGRDATFAALSSATSSSGVGQDVRAIVTGLISSGVFRAVFGG